jgi:N-acetylmuramoyl-L-alanine amidase
MLEFGIWAPAGRGNQTASASNNGIPVSQILFLGLLIISNLHLRRGSRASDRDPVAPRVAKENDGRPRGPGRGDPVCPLLAHRLHRQREMHSHRRPPLHRNDLRRWYPRGVSRTASLLAFALAALVLAVPAAHAREPRFEPLPTLETGRAEIEIEGGRLPVNYSRTVAGIMVPLQPLVARLGGELEVGPLGQRHELQLSGTGFVFGPGAGTMTYGEEIENLSQPPAPGVEGLLVPIDLLEKTYSRLLGYDFRWSDRERLLTVSRQPAREIPATLDVVSLEGVTTLVFQFSTTPRYRLEKLPGRVQVDFIGDRIALSSSRPFTGDEYVRDVRFSPQRIIIDLAPRTRAQDYALEEPFRLVLDVLRDTAPRLPQIAAPDPRSRSGRVETIIIDPGHGGGDTGAIGPEGTEEKHLTLEIARLLARELEIQLPVRAILTRTSDLELPLDTRSAIANQNKGDLFISIHLNSSPDSSTEGAETYFLSFDATDERAAEAARLENTGGDDPLYDLQLMLWDLAQTSYMSSSQRLAGLVQAELNSTLGLRNRGVKQAPFRVLVGAAMPAILVELGFLNNPAEEALLVTADYRESLVEALLRAVKRYVSVTEKRSAPDTPVNDSTTPAP